MSLGARAQILGARAQDSSLVVAATTSVEDSGLFDHINPIFTARSGIAVRIVSRASATALMTAERGTIDVVIVNDAEALDRFVALGEGTRRLRLMSNQFVIVRPQADPANIKGMADAAAALRRSRGCVRRSCRAATIPARAAEQRSAMQVNPKARAAWYRGPASARA